MFLEMQFWDNLTLIVKIVSVKATLQMPHSGKVLFWSLQQRPTYGILSLHSLSYCFHT